MCALCLLIPILVGLICAILGYLLGQLIFKKSRHYIELQADLMACRAKSAEMQSDLDNLTREHEDLKVRFAALSVPVFDAALAASVFGMEIAENDLKIVEGIGPKIEELFHKAGITTWKALSEISPERCREILGSGGDRYRIHDPSTWPKQCEMAYRGKWQELKEWQGSLNAGKE
mgnify:CR=1 FL=1